MIERYTREGMARIWSLENKFEKWLLIEILACEAWAELGVIPREAVSKIRQNASFSVERIAQLEEETRHDVVAFTRCVAESLGDEARYVHYGLTSSDVVDTALSVQIQEAAALIDSGLEKLEKILEKQAREHRNTAIVGRTHGVHAEPTSLGLKFALWLAEVRRDRERLERSREGVRYGKLSGAVGNYAHIDPFVEEYVCTNLGLKVDPVSTQIVQRDRHAELIFTLALIASLLEKIALEIRLLQRTEVRELEEPFYQGQKGSSAMPHKRNPVLCEQVAGLSRIVRSSVQVALENVPLWHERDITHSSAERVIFPDTTILVDYLLNQMCRIVGELHVYPENMARSLEATGGLVYSQRVLLALVEAGISRENAYDLVQSLAMKSWSTGRSFMELLREEESVIQALGMDRLNECFTPDYFLKKIGLIYRRLGLE